MSSPTPSDHASWRTQPTIIVDFSTLVVPAPLPPSAAPSVGRRAPAQRLTAYVMAFAMMALAPASADEERAADGRTEAAALRASPADAPTSSFVALSSPPDTTLALPRRGLLAPVELAHEDPHVQAELAASFAPGGARRAVGERSAVAAQPGGPAELRKAARVALASGELDEALLHARQVVARDPYRASSHMVLGDVLRARGMPAAADLAYARAAQLSHTRVDTAATSLPRNPF